MQCPQCGAPVEVAPGHPPICHFCHTALPADGHAPATESFQPDVAQATTHSFDEPVHHEAPFRDDTPARGTVSPVVRQPSSSGSMRSIAILAILVLVGIGVAVALRGGKHHGGHRGHHAASGDPQKP